MLNFKIETSVLRSICWASVCDVFDSKHFDSHKLKTPTTTEILRGGEIYVAPELEFIEVRFERGLEASYGASGSADWADGNINDMGEF